MEGHGRLRDLFGPREGGGHGDRGCGGRGGGTGPWVEGAGLGSGTCPGSLPWGILGRGLSLGGDPEQKSQSDCESGSKPAPSAVKASKGEVSTVGPVVRRLLEQSGQLGWVLASGPRVEVVGMRPRKPSLWRFPRLAGVEQTWGPGVESVQLVFNTGQSCRRWRFRAAAASQRP